MLKLQFSPFPELETERLILRCIQLSDAPALFDIRTNPEVLAYMGRDPFQNIEEAETFIREKILQPLEQNEGILWVIALKENRDKLIGTTGFWRMDKEHYRTEIGYMLHPAFWKKGIMREAIAPTIDYIFKHSNIHSIEGNIDPENVPSGKVLESLGFVKEAHFRENYFVRGVFKDSYIYSLLSPYPPQGIDN